jgi:hypothetical protein|tara:strand:+ start:295 stop:492 length:198 start_codon:yes stop_codon:yes gene_type:complete
MAENDRTSYDYNFKAPVLPIPPEEYSRLNFVEYNNILRIYFNQLDDALRSPTLKEQSDAMSWFMN